MLCLVYAIFTIILILGYIKHCIVMQSIIMLSVVLLSVAMLRDVAPFIGPHDIFYER